MIQFARAQVTAGDGGVAAADEETRRPMGRPQDRLNEVTDRYFAQQILDPLRGQEDPAPFDWGRVDVDCL